ncbi:MAG: hypothetical protein ACK55Z_16005, partial [bacterium]
SENVLILLMYGKSQVEGVSSDLEVLGSNPDSRLFEYINNESKAEISKHWKRWNIKVCVCIFCRGCPPLVIAYLLFSNTINYT